MKITRAEFVTSLTDNREFPGCGLTQIAVAGKSNVGKSSLINGITNHKKLAKTSSQPGLTRAINVFLINEQFHLIDLPGYGYAKVSHSMKEEWATLMRDFLMESHYLVHIFHLVDMRHTPGELDQQMAEFLKQTGLPGTVIATKADKLSRSQQAKARKTIAQTLDIEEKDIIAFSSVNKQGKEELLNKIEHVLKETSKLA